MCLNIEKKKVSLCCAANKNVFPSIVDQTSLVKPLNVLCVSSTKENALRDRNGKGNSPTVVRGAYCSFWTPSALWLNYWRMLRSEMRREMLAMRFSMFYLQSLPETVMKCWPFGDPCACTTATWAVTCWPFWFWPFGDVVRDSATRIWESLESDDSKGTTSITLTLPEGAVCRIIFF